jgi:hypothetical protein
LKLGLLITLIGCNSQGVDCVPELESHFWNMADDQI